MAEDNVTVSVGGEASGATDSLKDVAAGVKDLKDQISQIREGVSSFKDAFASAFTVEKVFEFVEAMTASATQVERLKTALGVTAEVVDSFDVMGRAAGTTVSAISEGMTRLEQTIARANGGLQRSIDALASLGLKARDFNGLDMQGKFDLIASKLAPLKDGTEKTAIAQQLLGGAASALIPIMNSGAGALEKYNEVTRRASSAATPEFLAEMGRLDLAMIETGKSLSGLGQAIITGFAPALAGLANTFSIVIQGMTNSSKEGGSFAVVLKTLEVAAQGLATALIISVEALNTLWEVTKVVVFAIGESFFTLGRVIKAVFTFSFADAKTAFEDLGAQMQARAKITAGNMQTIVKDLTNTLRLIWNKAAEDETKIDQDKNAKLQRTNQDRVIAALAAANGEVAAAKERLRQITGVLEIEASLGQITQNTKFAQLQRYTEQAYQEELRALQNALTIGGLRLAQQQGILEKIKMLKASHETEMINLDRQSLQTQMGIWRQYTDAVTGAFNSQLRGLLTGQTSFTQAMKNVLLDLSIKTIELIATKPLSEFMAAQLAKLTAVQSGAAAQAATEIAGAEAALPAKIAAFTSDLTARAALVFAGIFANLSPLMGPAAAAPAAAGEATVMAQMAAVPKFDVGAWSVPQTGLAVVHAQEFIAPAGAPADAARAAASGRGGGGPMTFIIQAWDGASVDSWLKGGGAGKLAVAVSGYQDKNPSSRRRR